jgi:D-beta-D-heptose 7-phosphate kinase/D-beta-D-heptose 1-phosphate adenosyltransferase
MTVTNTKILTLLQAIEVVENNPTTLVTGSFDLLHLGHLRFIHNAKLQSPNNKLLLVLLSDQTIRERKGSGRPLFNQSERLEMLSYIHDIDFLLLWEQPWQELRNFVSQTKPKVLVVNDQDSGIDNKRAVIEAVGGQLVILKRDSQHSTSNIIAKIKTL